MGPTFWRRGRVPRVATLALVTVLALGLGACNQVPSGGGVAPLTCLARVSNASDYQAAFDQRGPLWSGGDGAVPVALPDGRVMWLFGDTQTGPVVGNRYVSPGSFVHNSLIVQRGTCFGPLLGGTAAAPSEWFPNPAPGQYYWPESGFVDASGTSVHVFLLRVANLPNAGAWGWRILDVRMATLSLPDLRVRTITSLPFPAPVGAPTYGGSVAVAGSMAYVYGYRALPTNFLPMGSQFVARIPTSLQGPWQYWDGSAWSSDPRVAAPLTFTRNDGSGDDAPLAALNVIPYGGGWLASAKRGEIISDDVSAWFSSSPVGPWQAVNMPDGRVATTSSARVDQFSYGGRVVLLPGSGATVIYSVNTSDARARAADAHLYGPRFAAPTGLPAPTARR